MKMADVLRGVPPDDSVHFYLVLGLEIGLFTATPYSLLAAALTEQVLWLWMIPTGAALGAMRGHYKDRHLDWNQVYAFLAACDGDRLDPTQGP